MFQKIIYTILSVVLIGTNSYATTPQQALAEARNQVHQQLISTQSESVKEFIDTKFKQLKQANGVLTKKDIEELQNQYKSLSPEQQYVFNDMWIRKAENFVRSSDEHLADFTFSAILVTGALVLVDSAVKSRKIIKATTVAFFTSLATTFFFIYKVKQHDQELQNKIRPALMQVVNELKLSQQVTLDELAKNELIKQHFGSSK